jgi:hypothetical protein
VFRDVTAAKARAADAVAVAMQATAAAVVSFGFLATAKWWPKAGDRITMCSGGKELVWRDIAAADAASIEVGMRVKVDKKGDGKSIEEATVVKAGAEAGTLDVRYGKGEGGETEGNVATSCIVQRLVHEWAHSSYMDGMVKEEKEDCTVAVVLEGFARVSDLGADSRPTKGARVMVMKEGEDEAKEGEITSDYSLQDPNDDEPYKVTFDDGSESGWLATKDVLIEGAGVDAGAGAAMWIAYRLRMLMDCVCSWTVYAHRWCMLMDCVCPSIVYAYRLRMLMDCVCSWTVYAHGLCMPMDCVCSWTVYAHGLYMLMDGVCPSIVYAHGWCMLIDGVCSWIVYAHGLCMPMDCVCSWIVYAHGLCMLMDCVC